MDPAMIPQPNPAAGDGLAGKVVVVTGAGQGIGRAYASHLGARGCRVVVAELVAERAKAVEEELAAAGYEALGVPTDVTDERSLAELVATTAQVFGRIDGLVNNAAIYDGLTPSPAADIDAGRWRKVMDVNVRGTFLAARAVHPVMREQGGGRIVNISSSTALLAPPLMADYVASKGAVLALTKALAREWGPDGVTVNAVAPGGTWTEATEHMFGVSRAEGADPEVVRGASIGRQAIARQQYPEDVVGAVAFLLSDHASMITGQTLVVDGGVVLH